jgi:hypothetical protein
MAEIVDKKKVNYKHQAEKDREPVKGIFHFYETPGATLSFYYRKYKDEPIERFDLVDGQIHTIPLGVAKHLNKEGKIPVHSYKMDQNGNPVQRVTDKISRFGFQSLEFMDDEDLSPTRKSPISTVENLVLL